MDKTTKNLRQLMRFYLLIGLIGGLFCLGIVMPAEAEVIFEDNFDNYGDWSSTTEYGTNLLDKDTAPFNLTADSSKPGWVSYRYAKTANQVGDPIWSLTSEAMHSGSKSLKYELENTYFDWNGGGMTLYLGGPDNSVSGEKELFISVWIKFEDNFVLPFLSNGYIMKLFRVYFGDNADLETSSLSSSIDYNNLKKLSTYVQILGNGYMKLREIQMPSIKIPNGQPFSSVAQADSPNFSDYKSWKRVMYHIKLNSNGNSDGLLELYIGDQVVAGLYNISLVNASEGLIENNKINVISVPDNYFQIADGIPGYSTPDNPVATNPGEVAFYIDDLVISTNYVPLDYVIGGLRGDVNDDGIVDILDLQACVNVFLGTETTPEYVQRAKEVAEPLDECNVLDVQAIVNVILG